MESLWQTMISTITSLCVIKMTTGFMYCPSWEYQPVKGEPCVPCSKCPENQIVRETCWGSRDTVCGPFTEFKLFARGESMSLHGENKRNADATDVTKNETPDSSNSGSWQTVTLVMICVLSVTGVLFMVLVAVTWHICRRQNKEALVAHADQEPVGDIPDLPQSSSARLSPPRSNPCSSETNQPNTHTIDQFEIDVSST